jgi:hypothetical protein
MFFILGLYGCTINENYYNYMLGEYQKAHLCVNHSGMPCYRNRHNCPIFGCFIKLCGLRRKPPHDWDIQFLAVVWVEKILKSCCWNLGIATFSFPLLFAESAYWLSLMKTNFALSASFVAMSQNIHLSRDLIQRIVK